MGKVETRGYQKALDDMEALALEECQKGGDGRALRVVQRLREELEKSK